MTNPRFNPTRREALALMGAGTLTGAASGGAIAAAPVRTRFGVNAMRLFLDGAWGKQPDLSPLADLAKRGIPFVRFAASGHWAGDWAKYEADPASFWKAMDRLFAAAEQQGVGLVPCVFWHTVALAVHCDEPMQAWADPASRTRTTAGRFTESFVERYDRSPAMMMYEFTNELNDWVDLPNVLQFWPRRDITVPGRGRMEQDRLRSTQLRGFVADFGRIIRARSGKPISMGSNMPRGNAWHLARGKWDTDSPEQFIAQFRTITPPELDVLSIHLYEDKYGQRGSTFAALPDLLTAFVQAAKADNRKSFIGEFGVPAGRDPDDARRRFGAMVNAIKAAGVDYAAVWNYSARPFQREWDIAPGGARSYQLDALSAANR